MKFLMVGGTFDEQGGSPSGYVKKLCDALQMFTNQKIKVHNGGHFNQLSNIIKDDVIDFKVIFWFANVSNDEEKLVKYIKQINPECLLVTSKRNCGEYDLYAIIAKALALKSNLVLEINSSSQPFKATILDPLANVYLKDESDINLIAINLLKRIRELQSFTRIGSEQVEGEAVIPDKQDFFEVIQAHADIFHSIIYNIQTTRFLGNASFRCVNGFPSFRNGNYIFVSRRNVEKKNLDVNGFVPVIADRIDKVFYLGENKPSVDTPIQLRLYRFYPNINYMIHSHVYIKGAPITKSIIPCGAIEEFMEIVEMFPNPNETGFTVNLRGHGSLVLANSIDFFQSIEYREKSERAEENE